MSGKTAKRRRQLEPVNKSTNRSRSKARFPWLIIGIGMIGILMLIGFGVVQLMRTQPDQPKVFPTPTSFACANLVDLETYPPKPGQMSEEELQIWNSRFVGTGSEEQYMNNSMADIVAALLHSSSPIARQAGNYLATHTDDVDLISVSGMADADEAGVHPSADPTRPNALELELKYAIFRGSEQRTRGDLAQIIVHEYVHIRHEFTVAETLMNAQSISKHEALIKSYNDISDFYCGEMQAWAFQTAFYAGGFDRISSTLKQVFDENLRILSEAGWNWRSAEWYNRLRDLRAFGPH